MQLNELAIFLRPFVAGGLLFPFSQVIIVEFSYCGIASATNGAVIARWWLAAAGGQLQENRLLSHTTAMIPPVSGKCDQVDNAKNMCLR